MAISDIVSDEPVPEKLKRDPELWSGCISGAFHELELLHRLEDAGFHGIAVDHWEAEPFAVVEGIEFRSVTVTAHKGEAGPGLEANEAVVYRGPWKRVEDDEGRILERGQRAAVCATTLRRYNSAPYANDIIPIAPHSAIPAAEQHEFDGRRAKTRDPRETKGRDYVVTRTPGDSGCCS